MASTSELFAITGTKLFAITQGTKPQTPKTDSSQIECYEEIKHFRPNVGKVLVNSPPPIRSTIKIDVAATGWSLNSKGIS